MVCNIHHNINENDIDIMIDIKQLFYIALIPFFLISCDHAQPIVDGSAFLDEYEGPDVPTMSSVREENAEKAAASGQYQLAAQYYQQLSDQSPDNMEYKTRWADSLRRTGEYNKALALYNQILESDANNGSALEGKALTFLQGGDMESAKTVLELIPTQLHTWKTYNALGIIYSSKDDLTTAAKYFQSALQNNPSNAAVLNNMGLLRGLNQEYTYAIEQLKRAKVMVTGNKRQIQQIELNLALVYATSGNLHAAEEIARKYFEGATLHNNMGLFAHLSKDDQLAKTYLNMALTESNTFYQRAWSNLKAIDNTTPAQPSNSVVIQDSTHESAPPMPLTSVKKPVDPIPLTTIPQLDYTQENIEFTALKEDKSFSSINAETSSENTEESILATPDSSNAELSSTEPAPSSNEEARSGFESLGNWMSDAVSF